MAKRAQSSEPQRPIATEITVEVPDTWPGSGAGGPPHATATNVTPKETLEHVDAVRERLSVMSVMVSIRESVSRGELEWTVVIEPS